MTIAGIYPRVLGQYPPIFTLVPHQGLKISFCCLMMESLVEGSGFDNVIDKWLDEPEYSKSRANTSKNVL